MRVRHRLRFVRHGTTVLTLHHHFSLHSHTLLRWRAPPSQQRDRCYRPLHPFHGAHPVPDPSAHTSHRSLAMASVNSPARKTLKQLCLGVPPSRRRGRGLPRWLLLLPPQVGEHSAHPIGTLSGVRSALRARRYSVEFQDQGRCIEPPSRGHLHSCTHSPLGNRTMPARLSVVRGFGPARPPPP